MIRVIQYFSSCLRYITGVHDSQSISPLLQLLHEYLSISRVPCRKLSFVFTGSFIDFEMLAHDLSPFDDFTSEK